jgi:hypothetical protein
MSAMNRELQQSIYARFPESFSVVNHPVQYINEVLRHDGRAGRKRALIAEGRVRALKEK